MTDTITAPKRTMSPEHKEKMRVARAKWLAEKKANVNAALPSAPVRSTDEIAAENARLREMVAKMEAAKPAPVDLSTLPTHEVFFEFSPGKGKQMERIYLPDDPRWEGFKDTDKYRHPITGSFVINRLTRDVAGNITARVHETVNQVLYGPALEAMNRHLRTGKHWIEQNPVKA